MSSYVSDLGDIPVLDEDDLLADVPLDMSTGYEERDWEAIPYGSVPGAPAFETAFDIPMIPRDEWADRIEEMERTQSRMVDLVDDDGVETKDQNGTNYCWINGPIQCMQVGRSVAGLPYVSLSPASVGAKIKNFRNVGGWGGEAIRYLQEHGAVPTELWPDNAIDRRYDTPEANATRKLYQADEFYELRPRNFDQQMTCALLRFPCSIAFNHWSHLIMQLDPVVISPGVFGFIEWNSWSNKWGKNGRAVFPEGYGRNRANADEIYAYRVVTAS